ADHELIEHKVMQIKLNRYVTNAPYGQHATEIEISHYASVGTERVLNRLRETFTPYLSGRTLVFHSFPFVFFTISRDLLNQHSALLLDVGGEVTELSLVANEVLWETVSFPFGRNFLLRRLAIELKTVPEEVISALKIYQRGGHNKLTTERINDALTECRREWLAAFKQALVALSESHFGSSQLWAVGDPLILSILLDWIKQTSYDDLLIAQRAFKTSLLNNEILKDPCAERKISLTTDSHLLLENIFHDRLMSL
ncbi:MAG: hypothetical protein AAB505_00115, partial [Patescibacteria group bacterium]